MSGKDGLVVKLVVELCHLDDALSGLLKELLAGLVGGEQGAVAGLGESQCLGKAVHGVRGEHAGAGSAGRAAVALGVIDLLVGVVLVRGHDHDVDEVKPLVLADLLRGTPTSIGPPETKMVGMLRRMVASSMPGVTLSQLEMQTRASTQWALHMYSTESAMISRLGRE